MSTPIAQLRLTLFDDGTAKVEGHLENKVAAYALLEIARDAVKDHKPALIQAPTLGVVR